MVAQSAHNDPATLALAIEKAHTDYLESLKAKRRLPREFFGGVVRGFGMAIGGTIVFGIAIYLLGRFLVIPQTQEWVKDLQEDVATFQQGFEP